MARLMKSSLPETVVEPPRTPSILTADNVSQVADNESSGDTGRLTFRVSDVPSIVMHDVPGDITAAEIKTVLRRRIWAATREQLHFEEQSMVLTIRSGAERADMLWIDHRQLDEVANARELFISLDIKLQAGAASESDMSEVSLMQWSDDDEGARGADASATSAAGCHLGCAASTALRGS